MYHQQTFTNYLILPLSSEVLATMQAAIKSARALIGVVDSRPALAIALLVRGGCSVCKEEGALHSVGLASLSAISRAEYELRVDE
jgi:hypothetical protein